MAKLERRENEFTSLQIAKKVLKYHSNKIHKTLMRRVRCGSVSEKDAIAKVMWCERPYKEAAEDHLRVTLIRSGRHRYRQNEICFLINSESR